MKKIINDYIKDVFALKIIRIYMATLLVFSFVIIWKWSDVPSQVPLFYSVAKGDGQLGSKIQLALLPGLSILIFIINFFLSALFHVEEKIFSYLLLCSSLISSLLLLITFIKIIFLIA